MIKITLIETESILNSLTNLISKDLPIKISYSFSKLYKKVKFENELYIEQRNKLIYEYAEKDENNKVKRNEDGSIPLLKGMTEEFQNKFNELNMIEFEVDFSHIHIDELKIETCKGLELLSLEKFIID